MKRSLAGFFGVTLFVLGLACDDPATDLSEWTLADHTHQTEKAQKQQQRRAGPVTKAPSYAQPSTKRDMLIEVTWSKQCANCHGSRGRGDGPQSPMVKAKDLSSVEWQASVSDEQLTEAIKKGKGKMPAFNLPESVIAGLVNHVRTLPETARKGFPQNEGQAPVPGAPASPAGSAPAGSAPVGTASTPAAPPAPAPAAPPAEEEGEPAQGDNAH